MDSENTTPVIEPDSVETEISSTAAAPGSAYSAAAWMVTKWVGEKLASGIVGAIGGEIFGEVMKAIGMGGPDLVGKLDKISDQLTEVQRSIDRLTEMTAEILKQLAQLRDFMEKSLKIETLLAAMTRIETTYGTSGALEQSEGSGRPISLRLLTEKMPHFDGITAADLEQAAKDFAAYVSDVPDCIQTIRRVLAKAAFGQTSLLLHWAKELGQQVRDKKIDRVDACMVLEGYFLCAVSVQLKGVCVHGVALGTDRLGPQFIKQYLQDDLAEILREETSAYVEAMEYLIFSSLDPIMLTGVKDCMDEREFPKHVDEVLLRARLVAAALRLAGSKGKPDGSLYPTVQTALEGIYGTSLFRPSNLINGKAPDVNPSGYAPAQGKDLHNLPFPVLDLIDVDGRAALRDLSNSFTSVAHYFWEFASPRPAEGTVIDSSIRGGVTPQLYPLFGEDKPKVLVAGMFDVNRICKGLPSGAKVESKIGRLPDRDGGQYVFFHDQNTEIARHPLTNDRGQAMFSTFRAENIYKADFGATGDTTIRLFNYSGPSVKVRLWAYVTTRLMRRPRLDIGYGTAFAQEYDMGNHLLLRTPDGKETKFYDSVPDFGPDLPVSLRGAHNLTSKDLDVERQGQFKIDFDLQPGEYTLMLRNVAWFHEAEHRYEGWQWSKLDFTLRALSLEMVYPST